MSAAHRVHTAIIGAGAIGLSVARALAVSASFDEKEILVIESQSTIGSETSSRNSEVIHAGIYYPKNSLKAQYCVRGKQLLYDYMKERDIPVRQCGKLIVATDSTTNSKERLLQLRQNAIDNGVNDIEILSNNDDIRALEPNVVGNAALYSPSTGVFDSHSYMTSLLVDAENSGTTTLALSTKVDGGSTADLRGYITLDVDGIELKCRNVVNCAGLNAHLIAQKLHTNWLPPQQYYAKGNYFRLQGTKSPFSRLVYPLPDEAGGLGVHATVDWSSTSSGTKFGPDVEWISPAIKNPKDIDLTPSDEKLDLFYKDIRKYWPDLPDGSLVPDYAGIRPKLYHPSISSANNAQLDFRILGPDDHGVNGLYHLLGIESPGLTSSMAIAEYVAKKVFYGR
eukprot:CAMPEP_0194140124 /NCGR_PEP_ID=MMETSP0152-20130528/9724_1 /TAXON_ID=1049557 /ORGANISM="Thalassiothrix antarctica, Strain L6-D1" /LENGTH=394 /DNA_ID=CAMNT_0038838257 /DNA_START=12 /DNA_END=1193 /DNA_ORIENTATION=+